MRAELQAALDAVKTWGAAQEAVAKECPELCCPLSLLTRLMHDPVFTPDDGRTYERVSIEKHFEVLERVKNPIMSPQKQPLQSTQVVPNVTLKTHIVAMVQKKVISMLQKKADELAAGCAGKRRRDDKGNGRGS